MNDPINQHIDPNDRFDVLAYERYYDNGACVFKDGNSLICLSETDDAYIKQIYPPDPETVATEITYFPDTLTMSGRGQFLKDWDIEIGTWTSYDRFGEVTAEVNKDENYPVSWNEMRGHFLENDIHLSDIRLLRRIQNPNTGRYLWILTLNSPHGILDMASFDAETGELVERKQTRIKTS